MKSRTGLVVNFSAFFCIFSTKYAYFYATSESGMSYLLLQFLPGFKNPSRRIPSELRLRSLLLFLSNQHIVNALPGEICHESIASRHQSDR